MAARGRLRANAVAEALSIAHVDRIVVDASSVNEKQRGILDMPETEPALSRLLSRPELRQRYHGGQVLVIIY